MTRGTDINTCHCPVTWHCPTTWHCQCHVSH